MRSELFGADCLAGVMQFCIPSSALILHKLLLNANPVFLKSGYLNKSYSDFGRRRAMMTVTVFAGFLPLCTGSSRSGSGLKSSSFTSSQTVVAGGRWLLHES